MLVEPQHTTWPVLTLSKGQPPLFLGQTKARCPGCIMTEGPAVLPFSPIQAAAVLLGVLGSGELADM